MHPFVHSPHRTFLTLTVPLLFSLIVEPLMGIVDTAFVARLGSAPLAALGVATGVLSGSFWIFNFLGIGTQTEVGRLLGAGDLAAASRQMSAALVLAAVIGVALIAVLGVAAEPASVLMGARGVVQREAVTYMHIRLLAAPALLCTLVGFGVLRGLQDMRTPLFVAAFANLSNAVLDAVLIFGAGPLPGLGVAGAAWAATVSQWAGLVWVLWLLRRRVGFTAGIVLADLTRLLSVGRDLFLRTGLLFVFLLAATRAATRLGAPAGAAHQVIRQIWILTALLLDAYGIAAQSLVSFFLGREDVALARRAAAIGCQWGFVSGLVLAGALLAGGDLVAAALVPADAHRVFFTAWGVASLAQPLNALSFATDGVHWGAADYTFLRNVMFLATVSGAGLLFGLEGFGISSMRWIWLVTALWIGVRAAFGMLRVWPGMFARIGGVLAKDVDRRP